MTAQIFRYGLQVDDVQSISLPSSHSILSVAPGRHQTSHYGIDLWALTRPSHHDVKRSVFIFGTGNPIPENILTHSDFVGTAVMDDGLVWHVFIGPLWTSEDH